MLAHLYTHINTYTYTYIHTRATYTRILRYIRTHTNPHIHAHTHTHAHTYVQSYFNSYTPEFMRSPRSIIRPHRSATAYYGLTPVVSRHWVAVTQSGMTTQRAGRPASQPGREGGIELTTVVILGTARRGGGGGGRVIKHRR